MNRLKMDLQMFAEGGEGGGEAAAAAPVSGTQASTGSNAAGAASFNAGDTLGNGQQVQNAQVAAELNRQMKRHPELRQVYGQKPQAQQAQAEEQPAEKTIQEKWDELKKGEYKDLYGRDVQKAIQDRLKNHADLQKELDELQPILAASKKIYGVEDTAALAEAIRNDERLLQQEEDEAEAAGMTVEAYRTLRQVEEDNRRYKEQEQKSIEDQMLHNHYQKLVQQGEELKKMFPGFDLQEELKDPRFMRLTSPNVGLSVEDAFYAIHGKNVAAESMKAGMERAQKQLGQTIRAQGMRPVEGAAHGQGQPAAAAPMDFRNMSRSQREQFRNQVKAGRVVIPG